MDARQLLRVGTLAWAALGAAVALAALPSVYADARVLVGLASVLGPLAAVGAAHLLARGRDRGAGGLLLASALLTPTYFAYVLNVPALVVGAVLLVRRRTRRVPDAAVAAPLL